MPQQEIQVSSGKVIILGNLTLPKKTKGLIIFAHGSGSSRFSPRNRYVAEILNQASMATLLIDLLTAQEETFDEQTAQLRFDIKLLSQRLISATAWVRQNLNTKKLPIGYFGASTGAAAALVAAACLQDQIKAVVSRGGRPDLAGDALPKVKAATLLIVGGNDYEVIELNEQAYQKLNYVKKLEIVPGATHLFEEQGTLEKVSELAKDWFLKYL